MFARQRAQRKKQRARRWRMHGSKEISSRGAPFLKLKREQRLRVAETDFLHVRARKIERFHHRDGGANVALALLRIERTVGRKQHALGREKRNAADGWAARAGERGVAVEFLEIIERAFFQPLEDRCIVFIRGARAELIPAVADAALEIRNDAAEIG